MPRTFTRTELTTLSTADYLAMPTADREAFDIALVNLWVADSNLADAAFLTGDYDRVASNRRFEIGE